MKPQGGSQFSNLGFGNSGLHSFEHVVEADMNTSKENFLNLPLPFLLHIPNPTSLLRGEFTPPFIHLFMHSTIYFLVLSVF